MKKKNIINNCYFNTNNLKSNDFYVTSCCYNFRFLSICLSELYFLDGIDYKIESGTKNNANFKCKYIL